MSCCKPTILDGGTIKDTDILNSRFYDSTFTNTTLEGDITLSESVKLLLIKLLAGALPSGAPEDWTSAQWLYIISQLISGDTDNSLTTGTDMKLKVPRPKLGFSPGTTDNQSLPSAIIGGDQALLGVPVAWLEFVATNGQTYRVPAY